MKKQKSRDFLPSNRRTDMDARSSFQQRQRQRQHKEKITALFRSFDKGQGLWFICESHVGQEVFNGAVLKCRSHGHIQSTEPNSSTLSLSLFLLCRGCYFPEYLSPGIVRSRMIHRSYSIKEEKERGNFEVRLVHSSSIRKETRQIFKLLPKCTIKFYALYILPILRLGNFYQFY